MIPRVVGVRTAVALAAAAALTVPLLITLHARVPAPTHRLLFAPTPSDRLVPFEIAADAPSGRVRIHSARLVVQDAPALTRHQRILLTIATYRTVPRLADAELSFTGGACTYRAAGNIDLPDNRALVFERQAGCAPPAGQAAGEATLTFRLRNPARLALVAYVGESPPPRDVLVLASPGMAEARLSPILQGETVDLDPAAGATRAELLAYLWNLAAPRRWLDAAVVLCGVILGVAAILAWPGATLGGARQAAAAFLAALALAGSYAVLYPPFQVADEPGHFLVLTDFIGRPELGEPTTAWGRRGMFEEIRFNPYRAFSPLDRGHVGRPWTEVSFPVRDLHGAVRAFWRPLAALGRTMGPPQLFLTARLFHAAAFALTIAAFVLLVRSGTGSAASVSAAMPLFLVPTLPQFGMHVSNYAPLLDAYILLGAGIVIASWDARGSWMAGPILGCALGAAIGISRSSLPLLPLVACVLGARVVLGDREARPWTAWAFWGGFALLLAGMLTFIRASSYATELDPRELLVESSGTRLIVLLRSPWLTLLRSPWLVLPFGALGLIGELVFTRGRRAVASRPSPAAVRWIAIGAAAGAFGLFAASLVVPYPELPLYLPSLRPPAAEYVRQAVRACATFLRFGRPDWLTSVTFFAGFGWLDTIPAVRLVSLLAGASGMMLVLLLVWVARSRSTRTLFWLGCGAAGFLTSAAAYALSVHRTTLSDLHGRYLLGLYLCALVVCWTGAGRTAESSPWSGRYNLWAVAALAGVIAVNVYSLRLILLRYFS